jgi:site-specific recombinase XerD
MTRHGAAATANAAPTSDPIDVIGASWSRSLRAEAKSALTTKTYLKAVRSLSAFLRETGRSDRADDIGRVETEEWLGWLRETKHYSPATLAQFYRSIQQFWKYAVAEGDAKASPLAGLAVPRIPDTPPHVLTERELAALYDAARGKTFTARRNLAILRLFTSTGMRRSEMAGIKVGDLDLDRERVTVTGKGGHTRTVTFGRNAGLAIDRYLRVRANHPDAAEPAFWLGKRGGLTADGIAQIVKAMGEAAGVDVHAHLFRHTFAATALGLGMAEQDISELAGWRSPLMVQRYGRAARAERAMERNRINNPGDVV